MITSDSIRDAAVFALVQADTLAAERVYSPRDWPTAESILPAIIVRTPNDSGESLGRFGPPSFTTTVMLSIAGRVKAATEGAADTNARLLRDQILAALLCNGQFIHEQQIQQFSSYASKIDVTAEGGAHLGDASVTLAVEILQVFEPTIDAEGAPIPDIPLTQVQIKGDLISPFDATGDYPTPSAPTYKPDVAPRDAGPDGRVEAGLTIDLPQS